MGLIYSLEITPWALDTARQLLICDLKVLSYRSVS